MAGVRGLGHRAGVERDAAGARPRESERHEQLLAIEIEQPRCARGGAEGASHAGLVEGRAGLHAGRRHAQPALHFEGDRDGLDDPASRQPMILRDGEDRGQRRRRWVVERIPRVVEVERMRHGAVGVGGVGHGGLEAAADDARLRRAAEVAHVGDADAADAQRFGCAGQHDGEAVERDLTRHVDRGVGQRVVAHAEDAVGEASGEGVAHVFIPLSIRLCG